MTYTAALIGAGRIGRIHADIYANTDGIDLVAVVEPDAALRRERCEMWGIEEEARYASIEELLTAESVDVISVATPTSFHHEVVIAAAESPSPPSAILCEKPLAESASHAAEMVAACEAAGTELVVDHTLRFSETYRALRELVATGELGTVHSVQLHAGGSLMRLGTHYVDCCSFLLDDSIAEIRGGYLSSFTRDASDGEFDDRWGATTLLFEGGAVAQLDLTRSGTVANRLTLVGDKGMVEIQGSDASSIFSRELAADFWRVEDGEHVRQDPPTDLEAAWSRDMSRRTRGFESDSAVRGGRGMYAAQSQFDALGAHLVALLDGEERNRSRGIQGAHVVEALVATFISDATGSNVPLPLDETLRSTRIRTK